MMNKPCLFTIVYAGHEALVEDFAKTVPCRAHLVGR